ncbi:unnamed protein product [Chrysoparadoxa australica]
MVLTPEILSQVQSQQQKARESSATKAEKLRQRAERIKQKQKQLAEEDPDYDWTKTYKGWDDWEDPEELLDEAAMEAKKTENALRSGPGQQMACSHDHSAERKIVDLSTAEKLAACEGFKAKGNSLYAEGQYRRAAQQYRLAMIYYDYTFAEGEEAYKMDALRLVCCVNSAACFVKVGEWGEAREYCQQALREDPTNVKALFRRAQVYSHRDEFEAARADLLAALKQNPSDFSLRKELMLLEAKVTSYKQQSAVMGKQIFGGSASEAIAEGEAERRSPPVVKKHIGYDLTRHRPTPPPGKDDLYRPVTVSPSALEALELALVGPAA